MSRCWNGTRNRLAKLRFMAGCSGQWTSAAAGLREPPYTEPYVLSCGRATGLTPPPSRCAAWNTYLWYAALRCLLPTAAITGSVATPIPSPVYRNSSTFSAVLTPTALALRGIRLVRQSQHPKQPLPKPLSYPMSIEVSLDPERNQAMCNPVLLLLDPTEQSRQPVH